MLGRVAGRWRPVAVCVFLLALLATAPARLLGHLLPSGVHLAGYGGTVWSGSAAHGAVFTGPGWFSLGEVRWRLSPLSLLMLSPRVELSSDWGNQRLHVDGRVSPNGTLRVYRLDGRFPASLVRHWLPVQLRGEISLTAQNLVLAGGAPQSGDGQLTWRRAWWVGDHQRPGPGGTTCWTLGCTAPATCRQRSPP